MTPRELRDEVASVGLRRKDDGARDLTLAWHAATFGVAAYVGKLPDLRVILSRVARSADRLTPAAQRTQVALLSEFIGVPMRPLSDEAKRALTRIRES
jgi:hypothetical protein